MTAAFIIKKLGHWMSTESMLVGALVGCIYGVLPGVYLTGRLLAEMMTEPKPSPAVSVVAAAAVLLWFTVLGGIIGGILGGLSGLIFGAVNGVVIGGVTALVFRPVRHARHYRWSLLCISSLVTFLSGRLVVYLLVGFPPEAFGWFFVGVPTLIAVPCAWWVSARLARWYLAETLQDAQLHHAEG